MKIVEPEGITNYSFIGGTKRGKVEVNWFERHLNITLFFALFVCSALAYIFLLLAGFMMSVFWPLGILSIILCFGSVVLSWRGLIWVIRQKQRSLWHLLWYFVPFGFIVWFLFENKKVGSFNEQGKF